MYAIRMGVPEMESLWNDMSSRSYTDALNSTEKRFFKKWVKAMGHLRVNPRHPGLQSHEIDSLTSRYGFKVFQSYLENNIPKAGRLFWAYGPGEKEITILGIEPHPESGKRGGYDRIKLSRYPPLK